MKREIKSKSIQILSLAIVFLMMAAVSIRRDHKLLGHDFAEQEVVKSQSDTMRTEADGTIIINTKSLAKDISGYGGQVPLEIYIKDGRVSQVKALPNSETPEFFGRASTLLSRWNGKTLDEAAQTKVDAVSGATYSSRGIIGNMQRGLQYAGKHATKPSLWQEMDLSAKTIAGLIVALMAAIVPLFIKNRRYRMVQQLLNIGVLGFWCGSFMSYSSLIGYVSNGIHPLSMLLPTLLLIVAFIYPLFGKKSYYCTNVCPYGSLQELAGRCTKRKLKMSSATIKRLDTFRKLLWGALMICLWTGVWGSWVDYEPFSAFIFQSASWAAIAIAVLFIVLSLFTPRPYCRFVCPMGTLFKVSQSSKLPGKRPAKV